MVFSQESQATGIIVHADKNPLKADFRCSVQAGALKCISLSGAHVALLLAAAPT
jgi:hypothetical protein